MRFMMMNEHNKEGCMKASRHPHTMYDFITLPLGCPLYSLTH